MSTYCSRCGTEIPSGAGFCPSCGTPAPSTGSAAAPDPALAGYAPVNAPAPMAAPPQAWGQQQPPAWNRQPPPAKSGGGLKIVLIVLAVVVGVGVLVASFVGYGVYKVVHSVKVDDKGNVALNGLGGGMSMGANVTATEAELGVPIFPGATRGTGGLRMKNKGVGMVMVVYKTSASVDSVVAFYKSKMPGADETTREGNRSTILKQGDKSDQTMVVITPVSGSDSSATNITITHTQQPAN